MVFVDPFFLTMTLIFVFILIFANIYFLAHYAHHADAFFGSSTAVKAVLVSFIPPSPLLQKYQNCALFVHFSTLKQSFGQFFFLKEWQFFDQNNLTYDLQFVDRFSATF